MSVTIEINGADASDSVESWEISNPGGWVLTASVKLIGSDFWSDCDPLTNPETLKLVITVDETAYSFLIEERSETVSLGGFSFSIWGRSKQAYLGEKFSTTINDTAQSNPWENSDTTVSEILTYLGNFTPHAVTINWNVTNYPVYSGSLSVENQYPIDVIKRLAVAIGAELVAEVDGSLTAKEFVVANSELPAEAATYTDTDDIVSLSSRIESTQKNDCVVVYGYGIETQTPQNYLSAEILEDGPYYTSSRGRNKYTLRVFLYSDLAETPTIFSSDGVTVTKKSTTTYYDNLPENATGLIDDGIGIYARLTRDEIVKISWGRGNTAHPDTTGETIVAGTPSTPFEYSNETYSSYFIDYDIYCSKAGSADVVFYFSDSSAETQISIPFENSVAEIPGTVSNQPFLSAQITTPSPYFVNDPITVRVHYFHESFGSSDINVGSIGSITSQSLAISTESKTEEITLTYGVGTQSMPDTNGSVEAYSATHLNDVIAKENFTYSVSYKDFDIRKSESGSETIVFYWKDNSGSASVDFTIEGEAEIVDHDITIVDKYSREAISGATVVLDGTSIGITDSNGNITLEGVTRDVTYPIVVTATGYQDSDEDQLTNDEITIP